MVESRIKGRVKGLLGTPPQPTESYEDYPPPPPPPTPSLGFVDPDAQRQALQVLTLAQRTADEHIATAQRQADEIRAGAKAAAEQVAKDAQAHDANVRRDAEKALTDARAQASEIVKAAQGKAADLERHAQEQYDQVVGSLETQRAGLQEQIDGLQQFDREYRARLRQFMNSQLQALGDEEPPRSAAKAAPRPAAKGPTTGVVRVPEP